MKDSWEFGVGDGQHLEELGKRSRQGFPDDVWSGVEWGGQYCRGGDGGKGKEDFRKQAIQISTWKLLTIKC